MGSAGSLELLAGAMDLAMGPGPLLLLAEMLRSRLIRCPLQTIKTLLLLIRASSTDHLQPASILTPITHHHLPPAGRALHNHNTIPRTEFHLFLLLSTDLA